MKPSVARDFFLDEYVDIITQIEDETLLEFTPEALKTSQVA